MILAPSLEFISSRIYTLFKLDLFIALKEKRLQNKMVWFVSTFTPIEFNEINSKGLYYKTCLDVIISIQF
jgi:hypothetical protein